MLDLENGLYFVAIAFSKFHGFISICLPEQLSNCGKMTENATTMLKLAPMAEVFAKVAIHRLSPD